MTVVGVGGSMSNKEEKKVYLFPQHGTNMC